MNKKGGYIHTIHLFVYAITKINLFYFLTNRIVCCVPLAKTTVTK